MMNGIPPEVKFLSCVEICSMEDNPNLYVGVRLSQDVKFVAGDQVNITHKARQKTKMGNMTVVCIEKRKDKLYLVGLPDPELPPPPHAGPNTSAPFYCCPLLVFDKFLHIDANCSTFRSLIGSSKFTNVVSSMMKHAWNWKQLLPSIIPIKENGEMRYLTLFLFLSKLTSCRAP